MRGTQRTPTEGERRRTVLFAIFVCFVVFFSEEASHKDELARKRLRNQAHGKSPFAVSSEVALEVFNQRLNISEPHKEIKLNNVYIGEYGNLIQGTNDEFGKSTPVWVVRRGENQKVSIETEVDSPSETAADEDFGELERNKELRWNFDQAWRSSLEGVGRVRGTLWIRKQAVMFDGVHLMRQHHVTVFTRHFAEKNEVVLGLATKLPNSMRPANVSQASSSSGEFSLNQATLKGSFGGVSGLAFGEPVMLVSDLDDSGSSVSSSSWSMTGSDERGFLFRGCEHPIRFDLKLHYNVEIHGDNRPVSFSGVGRCRNSSVVFAIPETQSLLLDIDDAVRSASIMSFFSIVESVRLGQVLSYMGPLRNGVLTDLGPLSMGAFGWIALTDMYLCELLMNMSGSVGGEGWWVTAAVFKGIQFLFTHVPLLVLIFFGRSRLNAEPNDAVVRNLSTCMSRAQIIWLVSMFVFEFLRQSHPRIFALLWVSFWVPQIYCTATLTLVLPVSMKELTIISVFRAVWPCVALSTNILDTFAAADKYGSHTEKPIYDPTGALMVVVWLAVQLLVVYLQMKRGPQFFIPRFMLPKKFDYFAGREKIKEGEECVVCMQAIMKEDAVFTPCSHVFHEKCLGPWLQVKRSCPTCRATLPPLVL